MPQAENKVAFANPESKTMSADEQAQVTTQTESDVATSHKKGGASSGTDGGLKAKEPSERRGSKSKEVTIAKRGPPPPLDLENLLTIMTKLGQGRAFRDVFARFWQYGGRAISGFYLDEGVWWRDLERTGSMCRKWMRFFMPIAAYRAIRQFNSIPKLNPDLKFWMTGESFFNSIYCLVDHVIFLQNINLIKADAVQREWWGRFVEVWWIFEILCALRKENINLQVEKAKERPDSEVLRMIKLRMFKYAFQISNSTQIMIFYVYDAML